MHAVLHELVELEELILLALGLLTGVSLCGPGGGVNVPNEGDNGPFTIRTMGAPAALGPVGKVFMIHVDA